MLKIIIEVESRAFMKLSALTNKGVTQRMIARALQVAVDKIRISLPEKVEGPKPATSRADRLGQIVEALESTKSDIEELKSELESWRENIPENLQGGEKYAALEQAEDELDNGMSSIDEAVDNANGVEFPGMV